MNETQGQGRRLLGGTVDHRVKGAVGARPFSCVAGILTSDDKVVVQDTR